MFWFFAALTTMLIFALANPTPSDSTSPGSDLDAVSFNSDSNFAVGDNLPDSTSSSDATVIANSITATDPKCLSDASMDGDFNDIIQKRQMCMPEGGTKTPAQSSSDGSGGEPEKSTSTSAGPCGPNYPEFVSCGGPEALDPRDARFLSIVLNCVPGIFFIFMFAFTYYLLITYSDRHTHTIESSVVQENDKNC